jgi:signal transduction histidine kinase
MTLRTRFALSLLTIIILLLVPLAISLHSLGRLEDEVRALRDREFAASLIIGRLRDGIADVRSAEQRLAIVRDAASRDELAASVDGVARLADALEQMTLVGSTDALRNAIDDAGVQAPREAEAALAGRVREADSIANTHVLPAVVRAERGLGAAERVLRERTRVRVEGATEAIARAEQISALSLGLALLLALGVAVWLARSISGPVSALERGMRAVADGDFSHELPLRDREDEFGRLAVSFQQMSRQLAELDKLKAEFVSVASHELKTPINVVGGYLQLLDEGVYGDLGPRQRDVLRTIQSQTQSLSRLVKQLLDVSRFEAGGGKLEPRPIALRALLDEMEQAFHVLAVQREVRFLVQADDSLPEQVVWDEDRITEVLGNLLSNAFKFTSRGGSVELVATALDDAIALEVRDSGRGIPAEQVPQVFQKFFQADNQYAGSQGGTGLGLAIAKGIVEAHGGDITVESTMGVGTTFRIVLPPRVSGTRRSTPIQLAEPTTV